MTTTDPAAPATVTRLERGYCPVCALNVAVKVDGTTRQHTSGGGRCAGSGQPATETAPSPLAQAEAQAGAAAAPDDVAAAADLATSIETAHAEAERAASPAEEAAEAADAIAEARAAAVDPPATLDEATGLPAKTKPAKKAAKTAAAQARPGGNAPVLLRLPLDAFDFSPSNPRTDLGPDEDLVDLGNSIAARGLVEPVVARRLDDGRVELIAGARRLEAARRNGKVAELDVLIRDASEAEALELALVENAMRRDLPPMDEAGAYWRLIDEFGYTQAKLAERLGRSQPHVSKRLSLLKLPEQVKVAIAGAEASLHVRDAETLAKLPPKVAAEAFERAAAGGANADKVARNLPGAVRAVKAEGEAKAKVAAGVKTLTADGVRVVDWPGVATRLPEGVAELDEIPSVEAAATKEVGNPDELDRREWFAVLAEVHKACPGHAGAVDREGGIHYVCTNVPDLHPADLEVTADEPAVAARRESDALEREIAQANLRRLDAMRSILEARRTAADTDYTLAAYLETQDVLGLTGVGRGILPEAKRAMVDLLGVPVPPDANWVDLLEEAVPANGMANVALALALAAGDRQLHDLKPQRLADPSWSLAPAAARHLRFLIDGAFYTLADHERRLLADAEGTDAVEDGPSVDEWEGPAPSTSEESIEALQARAVAAEEAAAAGMTDDVDDDEVEAAE